MRRDIISRTFGERPYTILSAISESAMTEPHQSTTPDTGPPESWAQVDHVCDAACEDYLARAWEVFEAQIEPGDFEIASTTVIMIAAGSDNL